MQSLVGQFASWAASKPADQTYNYCDPGGCAFRQFLRETGIAHDPAVGSIIWNDGPKGPDRKIPLLAKAACQDVPWTFGALAARLATGGQ